MSYNLDRLELLDYEQGEHLWPAITYASVTNYFLHKPCHDGEATKAYKSTDAYQYVKSGMCLPAAEQSADEVFLLCNSATFRRPSEHQGQLVCCMARKRWRQQPSGKWRPTSAKLSLFAVGRFSMWAWQTSFVEHRTRLCATSKRIGRIAGVTSLCAPSLR